MYDRGTFTSPRLYFSSDRDGVRDIYLASRRGRELGRAGYATGLVSSLGGVEGDQAGRALCYSCFSDDGDVFFGGAGNDVIRAGGGDDRVLGGEGNDLLIGYQHADKLRGMHGNDRIISGPGPGADELEGGPGSDVLYADDRKSDDSMSGGGGVDRCLRDFGDVRTSCRTR
jgi:Ca2+-binding RTX toxin-like protein